MALGTEVDLDPGHIVLDEDSAPGTASNFRLMSTVAKQLDTSGYHLVQM